MDIEQHEKEKQEWSRKMRLMFSPKDMISEDGSLNQEYFKPKQEILGLKIKKWKDEERKLLIQGIEKYGIGNWKQIKEELLPLWVESELRVKASFLIGRQSLKLYKGWKGDEEAIRKEFEKNEKIGKEFGCWKNNYLVNDDDGKVAERLQKLQDS